MLVCLYLSRKMSVATQHQSHLASSVPKYSGTNHLSNQNQICDWSACVHSPVRREMLWELRAVQQMPFYSYCRKESYFKGNISSCWRLSSGCCWANFSSAAGSRVHWCGGFGSCYRGSSDVRNSKRWFFKTLLKSYLTSIWFPKHTLE